MYIFHVFCCCAGEAPPTSHTPYILDAATVFWKKKRFWKKILKSQNIKYAGPPENLLDLDEALRATARSISDNPSYADKNEGK